MEIREQKNPLLIRSSSHRRFAPTLLTTTTFNHPKDDTIGGSSEVFRSNEINQLEHLRYWWRLSLRPRSRTCAQPDRNLYSTATPRNDASTARGQWDLADAYRYVNEAYGGYHINALHGINVDAGIFHVVHRPVQLFTTLTTGLISLPMCRPTRHGFSPRLPYSGVFPLRN